MQLVARSENSMEFREGFCRLGTGPRALWGRFLDLAPAGNAEFWVAFENGLPVGRVGASRLPSHSEIGAIGFFEAPNETVAGALLQAAEGWLKAQGVKTAVGPMALNTWFNYRFRTDDHELKFTWEPNNPSEYPGYWTKHGYEAAEAYQSPAAEGLSAYAERTYESLKRLSGEGFRFRPFDGPKFLETEVPILYELSQVAFKQNYLFEPITFEFFRELYVPLANKLDYSYSHFVTNAQGKEVGLFFAFPDQGYLVFKTICIHPDYQGRGLSTALSALSAIRGVESGIGHFVTGLVKDGNRSESYTKKSRALWQHRYVLYRKSL